MSTRQLLIFILMSVTLRGDYTLDKAQRTARARQESPSSVGASNLLNPDYSAWYRQQSSSYFSWVTRFFGISAPIWSLGDFTQLMAEVTAQRELAGYTLLHDLTINPRPGSQFIMVGPLYGAYHSLVRVLTDLASRHIIDNELKVLKPDTFIVFLGNVVNDSPVNLETLTMVMALMKANPQHVVYITGDQELDNTWMGYGLKREITQRLGGRADLESQISQFFATLPRALFIESAQQGIIRVGDNPSELRCPLSRHSVGQLRMCPLSTDPIIPTNTIIGGENRLMSYRQHPGLVQQSSQEGILTWSLFSAPNHWYREYFSFIYDAYVILTIGKTFSESVLTLYNQDIRELDGFHKRALYGVMSGSNLNPPVMPVPPGENRFIPSLSFQQKLADCGEAQGFASEKKHTKGTLYVGCSIDLTRSASPIGKHVRDGIVMRINKANAEGGIKGRQIQVVFMDDEYSPTKARQNVDEFVKKYASNLFLCNLGSPTLQTYLDLVKEGKIFLFFPITGAPIFRQPELQGIVHWRASYKTEAEVLTQYMISQLKIRDFAFLYQSDSYGLGALEGSNAVIKKEGIKQVLNVGYERGSSKLTNQIKQIKDASVSAIGFFSTSLAATEFIRQAGVDFFIGKQLFAVSDLAEESFKLFLKQRGLDIIISQFAPNPETSTLPLVQEFRRVLSQQSDTSADVFTLEGYISTSLLLYILEKTESYTIASLNKVLESIKNEQYKGLPLSFDPATRELVHELWLDTGGPKWIHQTRISQVSSPSKEVA